MVAEAGSAPDLRGVRVLEREDLRRETVRTLAVALAFGAVLGVLQWLTREEPYSPRFWFALAALAALFPAGLHLSALGERRPLQSSIGLVAGLFLVITIGMLAFAQPQLGYFYALAVIAGAALLGPAAASVAAAAAIVAMSVVTPGFGAWSGPSILVATTAVSCWLILRPLYRVLEWSWQRSSESMRLTEELQEQRGALNRTMKALELTNRLLQRTNHELALARREAEEARRLKEDFCAGISHELRTPLNIILGFAEIMHSSPEVYGDLDWPRTLRRDVAEIHRNAGYISSMVDDILDLARVEAMRMPVHREPTPIGQVITEACDIARQLLRDRPVALEVIVPAELPELPLDRVRIRQVLLNLLANAGRHTEEGRVTVSVERSASELIVAVADTGSGIPADQLEPIFNEFHQAGSWSRPGQAGKGLGLAVARRFVQMHGGRIWAESEVGRGSTFRFALPMERKDVSRLSTGSPAPLPVSPYGPCVVVLDDEEAAGYYLGRHLDGYEVVRVGAAAELAEVVGARHPQAIIVNEAADPDVSQALASAHDVPVIACRLPRPPRDRAGHPMLTKPVAGARLLAAVKAATPAGDVLVADDDRGFVQFVARLLQAKGGYSVRWAYNGRDALERMRERPPDVLLLDMVMPEMPGQAVIEAMAADPSLAAVPVVAVTGTTLLPRSGRDPGASFRVARGSGLTEGEVLALVTSSLECVKPGAPTSTGPEAL